VSAGLTLRMSGGYAHSLHYESVSLTAPSIWRRAELNEALEQQTATTDVRQTYFNEMPRHCPGEAWPRNPRMRLLCAASCTSRILICLAGYQAKA
jgi:hypothetical protein